jgi:hypothetical protein
MVDFPTYSFYFGPPDDDGKAYVPNVPFRIGPTLLYKRFGLKWGIPVSMPDREIDRRGRTEQINFVFSFYWQQYAVDLSYQKFKGFYLGSPLVEIEDNRPNRYTQFPEARSEQWSLNLYYNVSPSKYSLSSAFDSAEREIKRGHSWTFIPFYRHWEFDLGNSVVQGSRADDIAQIPNLSQATFDTLGTTIAYAVTETKKSFYITGLAGLGPAGQIQYFHEGEEYKKQVRPALKVNVNGSIGAKSIDNGYGAKAAIDTIYSRVSGTDVYSSVFVAELFYNYFF